MRVAGIVVAAGRGERLGGRGPKARVEVAGRALVEHAHLRVREAGLDPVVVVHPPDHADVFAQALPGAWLTPGGASRTDSVRAGLAVLGDGVEVVAVHDAARGLAPVEVVARAVAAVTGDVVAAAPAMPVVDTVKRVVAGEVVATVDRTELMSVQTPQVVRRDVLARALDGRVEATDELGLVEALLAAGVVSGRVVTVAGSPRAMKVTHPEDVAVLGALCREQT